MLEKGAFDKRTADFLWMMIFGAISLLVSGSFYFCIYIFRFDQSKRQFLELLLNLRTTLLLESGGVCYSHIQFLFLRNTYGQHARLCLEPRESKCSDKYIRHRPIEGM